LPATLLGWSEAVGYQMVVSLWVQETRRTARLVRPW
jgi:hypothetical protein